MLESDPATMHSFVFREPASLTSRQVSHLGARFICMQQFPVNSVSEGALDLLVGHGSMHVLSFNPPGQQALQFGSPGPCMQKSQCARGSLKSGKTKFLVCLQPPTSLGRSLCISTRFPVGPLLWKTTTRPTTAISATTAETMWCGGFCCSCFLAKFITTGIMMGVFPDPSF